MRLRYGCVLWEVFRVVVCCVSGGLVVSLVVRFIIE